GKDDVVLIVEKKSVLQLQDPRTVRKVAMLDDHICLTFAGLTADGRVLIDKARIECQSHRLTVLEYETFKHLLASDVEGRVQLQKLVDMKKWIGTSGFASFISFKLEKLSFNLLTNLFDLDICTAFLSKSIPSVRSFHMLILLNIPTPHTRVELVDLEGIQASVAHWIIQALIERAKSVGITAWRRVS
ncbi:MAG: proteasome subunit-domain-containing protein, partial [Lentinula lateritia]